MLAMSSTVGVLPNSPRRWPWRPLVWAFATSLIAHIAVFIWAIDPFSFNFQSRESVGALRTRTIIAPVLPLKPTESQPVLLPVVQPQPPLAPVPALVTEPLAMAAPVQNLATEPLPIVPSAEPSLKPNEAPAQAESVQAAAKTVVIALSSEPETTASPTASASTDTTPPLQLQLPQSVRLQFVATSMQRGRSREGRGQLSWQSDGQTYSLKIEASMLLITVFEWSSVGKISEVGLSPERFSERRTLRSEQATHFRPELGKIQFSNNKPDVNLEAGAQDRLSVMLLLSSLFAGNPERIAVGSVIRVQVVSSDLAETWDIRYDGLETVQLSSGLVPAHKLTRNARREFDRKLELWLAPSLGFMPVRILQSAPDAPSEDFFDLKLSTLP